MAEVQDIKFNVEIDPRVHAVEEVKELVPSLSEIIQSGAKVEIDFSTYNSVGVTSQRHAVTVTICKDRE